MCIQWTINWWAVTNIQLLVGRAAVFSPWGYTAVLQKCNSISAIVSPDVVGKLSWRDYGMEGSWGTTHCMWEISTSSEESSWHRLTHRNSALWVCKGTQAEELSVPLHGVTMLRGKQVNPANLGEWNNLFRNASRNPNVWECVPISKDQERPN